MNPILRQIVRRGLIAAGILAAFGFAVTYLAAGGIDSIAPGDNTTDTLSPVVVATGFAAVGFVLVVVFEGLGLLFKRLRGKKPAAPSSTNA